MRPEDKFWVWFMGIICASIVAIIVTIFCWHVWIIKTYTQAGYEMRVLPGSSFTYWQQVDPNS